MSAVPTLFIVEGYRFFFFANEGPRPHVHVEKGDGAAKLWLDAIAIERWMNLTAAQRRRILKLVKVHRLVLLKGWNEFFSSK